MSDDAKIILETARQSGNVLHLELNYPPYPNQPTENRVCAFQIGLMSVRAADDIRVSYDFDRDGWKIEQEEIVNDDGCFHGTGIWKEVAFVQAWGNERPVIDAETVKPALPAS